MRAQSGDGDYSVWSDWSETWRFDVEARDTTPPTIIESTPTGENVPVTTEITVTFSEPMNKESVESASYIYPEVSGELYWKDNTLVFTPGSDLDYDTRYVIGIEGGDGGAMDLAGNTMVESYEWDFETVSPELVPPTAIISAAPREINEGESVSFSAKASSDQDGYIVSYDWDFGDGDTDTGINVEHTYYRSGHYTATLTVMDNDNLSHSDRMAITVNPLVTPNAPPTAYIHIYPNPATEGEKVTFEGDGEDEDGEVVECRWTFPDGTTRSVSGSSDYFEDEDVQAGRYGFTVRDDDEAWSEEVEVELELETPPSVWAWTLVAMLLAIAAGAIEEVRRRRGKNKNGSIFADSNPQNALISLDKVFSGLSPATVPEVPVGAHLVKFRKFGYFDCKREAIVNANQTTHVHCDLTEIPGIKLKLSAEPTEIPADGKSKSIITIRVEDKNEIPIPVPEDVTVELVTNIGTIESPVKIPAGRTSVTATLTSSVSEGTAKVGAKALFLTGGTTVEFLQST